MQPHNFLLWLCLIALVTANHYLTVDEALCGEAGSHAGCLVAPAGCLTGLTCKALVLWSNSGPGFVDFELRYFKPGWVAVGFSPGGMMGDSSVLECVFDRDTGRVIVRNSYNKGHTNRVLQGENGIYNVSTIHVDAGNISCQFRRMISPHSGDAQLADLTKDWYLIMAYGNVLNGGNKQVHALSGLDFPVVTPAKINVLSVGQVLPIDDKRTYLKTHACLMLLAWLLLLGTGILWPRHFRTTLRDSKAFGEDCWFLTHRFCGLAAILLALLGIVFAFAYNSGNYVSLEDVQPNVLRAHPPLGLVIGSLLIVQVILGFSRPKVDSSWRSTFVRCHRLLGCSLFIAGVLNILLGFWIPKGKAISPAWSLYVMCGYIVVYIIVYAVLEVIACTCRQQSQEAWNELKPITSDSTTPLESISDNDLGVGLPKKCLLCIYLIGVTCVTVALIIGIATVT